MAFNPFESFRKYNKVLFVALAILCMFTFVLSAGIGGGGDFFDQVSAWIGGSPAGGSWAARINGKELSTGELQRLKLQRVVANQFMTFATGDAQRAILEKLQGQLADLEPEIRARVEPMIVSRRQMEQVNPQTDINSYFNAYQQYQQQLQLYQRFPSIFQDLIRDAEPNSTQFQVVRDLIQVLNRDLEQLAFASNPSLYFTNMPFTDSPTDEQILEFALYLAKAEQMGIVMQAEQIGDQVSRETFGVLTGAEYGRIEQILMQRYRGLDAALLREALGNEFRVRMVQTSLLGEGFTNRTRTATPDYVTPREFWEYYRENCTPYDFGLLQIDTADYVDKVSEQPTDEQLKALWNKHKREEPQTGSADPGFKQPRQIKVQWLGAVLRPDLYKQAVPLVLETFATLGGVPLSTGGGFVAPAVHLVAPMQFADALIGQRVQAEYDRYLVQQARFPWSDALTPIVHDSSVYDPRTVAALFASFAGAVSSEAPLASVAANAWTYAVQAELTDRVRLGIPGLLAGFNPAGPWIAAIPTVVALPEPLPRAAFRPQVVAELESEWIENLFKADLERFRQRLSEVATGPNRRQEANQYLQEFSEARGFRTGESEQLRSRFDIAEDPGLAPLAQTASAGVHAGLPEPPKFGDFFFEQNPDAKRHQALWYPNGNFPPANLELGETYYLAWVTEEKSPRVQDFAAIRAEVVQAWRRQQARKLAETAANDLAKKLQAKNIGGNRASLMDFAKSENTKYLELKQMNRLIRQASLQPGAPASYRTPEIPAGTIAFPTANFLYDPEKPETQGLFSLRAQPANATVIVHDRPKDHYYVATIVGEQPLTESDFYRVFANSSSTSFTQDSLLTDHAMPAEREQLTEQVLKTLKIELEFEENPQFEERN